MADPQPERLQPPPQHSQQPDQPQSDIVSLPEDIRNQVEKEQALVDAQRRVKELEGEAGKLRERISALEGERDGAVSVTNQLQTQLSSLQSSHHKATSALSVIQTRLDSIEREKRELYEETERLQQRGTRNTQELYALRSAKTDAAQKIAHLDVEVSELRMTTESAKFNEKRSTQALESARAEIITLTKAVSEVEERFGRYRAEAQSEQSKYRSENETLLTRLNTLEQSYSSLQRTYNDQSSRLAESHANIATLTSSAAANKAAVAVDMLQLDEANKILEKRGEEARATILEREAELERMAEVSEERETYWEARVKKEERLRKEADKRTQELKNVADRLDMAEGRAGYVSASAAVASELRKDGKSYTQLYTDFTIQESRLQSAEAEVERLTNLLDEISQELSEKKPLLDEQAAEHDRAIERANALASELSSVISSRDTLQAEIKSAKAASSHHSSEVSSFRSTIDDLARQVKSLLRQLAIKDDPSLANVPVDGDAEVGPTGDIVTDHLVEFKSIRSLQEQNQRLLSITRSLMAKLDEKEIGRAAGDEEDDEAGSTLDQATDMIKRLHKDLTEGQKKITDLTRERDFFSKLLAKGEGLKWSTSQVTSGGPLGDDSPHQQTIDSLQTEIDLIKAKAQGEVDDVRKEIKKRTEEAAKADVEKARAEAKVGLLEEQTRLLNEQNSLAKNQYIGLESQVRQLQSAVAQAHNEQRSALEQVAARQAEADRLRNEAAMLRAEKEQWKSVESRLHSDFSQVQSERVKLQQLIDNLKNVASEGDKSRAEERQALEKRIEELQREATALRQQVEQARAATRDAEAKVSDFESRLAAATTSVRTEKEAADALAATRATEIATIKADLEKAQTESESRLRIGLNWKRRADNLTEQIAQNTKSQGEAAQENEKKAQEAEKRVKELEGEVDGLKKKVEEVERAASLKEGTIQRLQSELTSSKADQGKADQGESEVKAQLTTLQKDKKELAEKLSQAEKDLEAAKAAASTAPSTSEGAPTDAEKAELLAKIEELTKHKQDHDEKYESNVTRVNRVNAQMKGRIDTLLSEKATALTDVETLTAKISKLESKVKEVEASVSTAAAPTAEAPAQPTGEVETKPSQEQIDEAVKAAVAAREAELTAKFTRDIEEATTSAATAAASAAALIQPPPAPESSTATALDAEALAKKTAELEFAFDARVAEAVQKEKSALEEEVKSLRGQVEELKTKIKALERQVKTAEISRKTLERQKAEAEKKLAEALEKKGEAPAAASALATAPAPASTPVEDAKPVKAEGTPTGTPAARGGIVRGKPRAVRGGAPGRPNSVLSAVNATLSGATPASTPESSGTKRPAPEEGESPTSSAAPPSAPSERGGRVLKRPRGGAAPRGGAGGRGGRGGGAAGGGTGGAGTN
ncbi:hypothetical protein L202_07665 [Cryptococcus amylolentus CBS 6039]|uniref:NUA/TPR/MLP1-2-like domain-containing protein n=1 Tax=Cryptococcus amylolentus CBS 6039 TaxID=1295533 RepID=A0A1E3HCZ5_9TREE|nr:hypothetical protein L202_07665 [Cryptococcus amylolentus CBS 6039]ODN74219.1 hypothetical protein L202_07665 [Cryptococcus amylolentus CBS 6039]